MRLPRGRRFGFKDPPNLIDYVESKRRETSGAGATQTKVPDPKLISALPSIAVEAISAAEVR